MKRFTLLLLFGLFIGGLSAVSQTSAAPNIVGGSLASAGEYPHMVSVGYRADSNGYDAHFCGGSLIKPTWVLTASHCVIGENASELAVIINRLDLRQTGGEKINVKRIIMHENYDDDSVDNDVALLELVSPSTQGTIITPLLSNEDALQAAGRITWVTGWGDTTDGGTGSPELREVDVPLIDNATCNNANGGVTANMICAGYAQGGKDSCQNDSGGPLVTKDANGNWRQVGVVSWGPGCAQPNAYGVYAKLSRYENWLEARVGELTPPATGTPDPNPSLDFVLYLPIVGK